MTAIKLTTWTVLLIADEQINMIEKYLYRGDMFALWEHDLKAVCVVTQEQPGVCEIKILSRSPSIKGKDMESI